MISGEPETLTDDTLDEERSTTRLEAPEFNVVGADWLDRHDREVVRITLDLPASIHRKLRQRVLDEETDAQKWLRRLVEQELRTP